MQFPTKPQRVTLQEVVRLTQIIVYREDRCTPRHLDEVVGFIGKLLIDDALDAPCCVSQIGPVQALAMT